MHNPDRFVSRGLILGCLLALSVAGCAGPTPTSTTPTVTPSVSTTVPAETQPLETPPRSPVVGVSVNAKGAITMPAELSASGYVFRVRSAAPAMVTVLEAQDGYTKAQLVSDLGPQPDEASAISAAIRFDTQVRAFGGAWSASGSSGMFARRLDRGTYWVVDLARRPTEQNVHTVTVTGDARETTLPEPVAAATATADRRWAVRKDLPAEGTLLIRNPTQGTHQLVIDPVPVDATPQEYLAATQQGRGAPLPGTMPGPSLVSAGVEFLWSYDLPPGEYVVMDLSLSESGYRQYAGAGAFLVTLS